MGALLMADELADARSRLAQAQAELSRSRTGHGDAEARAVAMLEAAAKRIEALAEKTAG